MDNCSRWVAVFTPTALRCSGLSTGCATSFPHALHTAASFNRSLFSAVGSIIGVEARSLANQRGTDAPLHALAPNVQVAMDPRWGRIQETAGEDVLLASEYAVAVIRGMQEGVGEGFQMMSMAKHFVDCKTAMLSRLVALPVSLTLNASLPQTRWRDARRRRTTAARRARSSTRIVTASTRMCRQEIRWSSFCSHGGRRRDFGIDGVDSPRSSVNRLNLRQTQPCAWLLDFSVF